VLLEVHRKVEDANNEDAVFSDRIEDAVPPAVVLKERARRARNCTPEFRFIGDSFQALPYAQIVALGLAQSEGRNRIAEDVIEICLGLAKGYTLARDAFFLAACQIASIVRRLVPLVAPFSRASIRDSLIS
jgi:hypothetical protein